MPISKEDMEKLVELSNKLGINIDDLIKPAKKDKKNPVAQYTAKYEVINNKCQLCGHRWKGYFAMQKYNDGVTRGKRINFNDVPANKTIQHLYYNHRHCNECTNNLRLWEKEKLIERLILDRRNI